MTVQLFQRINSCQVFASSWRNLLLASAMMTLASSSNISMAQSMPASIEDLAKLEKQVIVSRTSVKSAYVELISYFNTYAHDPTYVGEAIHHSLYIVKGSRRADRKGYFPNGQLCSFITVHTPNSFIRSNSTSERMQYFGLKARPEKFSLETPDPMKLGMIPWCYDTMDQFGYDMFMLQPRRDHFRIEPAERDGEKVWNTSYQLQGKIPTQVECALSPTQGFLPIYIAAESGEGMGRQKFSIENKLAQYSDGDTKIWYPSKSTIRMFDGERLTMEQVVEVQRAEFNCEIDPAIFTLKSLDIPVGRPAVIDSKMMRWNGQEFVR